MNKTQSTQAGCYIVGSRQKHYGAHRYSISTQPRIHPDYDTALKEAVRLAEQGDGEKEYVVMKLEAVVTKAKVSVTKL